MKSEIETYKDEIKSLKMQVNYCHEQVMKATEKWVIKEYLQVKHNAIRRIVEIRYIIFNIQNFAQ